MKYLLKNMAMLLAVASAALSVSACTASGDEQDDESMDSETTALNAADYVVLYKDCTFSGPTVTLRPTDNPGNLANFKKIGFNDQASAIVLSPGAHVNICSDADQKGTCLFLDNNVGCFSPSFNDKASSLRFF